MKPALHQVRYLFRLRTYFLYIPRHQAEHLFLKRNMLPVFHILVVVFLLLRCHRHP